MKWFNAMCEVLEVRCRTREEKVLAEMLDEIIYGNPDYTDEEIFVAVCKQFSEKYRCK